MNNFRWVAAGIGLGLLLAITPSCGGFGAKKCTPSNCPGCCTAEDRCDLGTLNQACGLNGGACSVCGGAEQCQGGFCTPIIGNNNNKDGGNNNGDGGTTCGPSNCNGCCNGNTCVPAGSTNDQTCGTGGAACAACTSPMTCQSGVCKDTTCSGCMSNNSCVPGNSTTACGTGGPACSVCGQGQTCTNGQCTGGTTCDSTTCPNGCCQNGQCFGGTSTSACGIGANTCAVCGSGQTCSSGQCTGGTACSPSTCPSGCCLNGACQAGSSTSACGTGGNACTTCGSGQTCSSGQCTTTTTCSPSTCPSGCCQNGSCVSGTSTAACGFGGVTCMTCGSGQSCTNQACTTTNTAKVSSPCTSSADCAGIGAGAYCKLATSSGNKAYQGGYCTKTCTSTADCNGQGLCSVGVFAEWGEGDSFCLGNDQALCTGRSSQGYTYWTNYCWFSADPSLPTPPTNVVGTACSADTQCQGSGSYPAGTCISGTTSWPNGYCSGYCTYTSNCASDSTCVLANDNNTADAGDDTYACFKDCGTAGTSQGICRTGYSCRALYLLPDAGIDPNGVCLPKCTSSQNCGTNYPTCNTSTGFCCNSVGKCI